MKKRHKICIVEDNEVLVNRLVDALSIDYEVYAAYNGFDAFQVIKEIVPDLIISDIMMPELDGFQLLRLVQSDKKYKNIPFIMLTALTDEDNMMSSYQSGAFDYITKPFSLKILIAKINNIFQRNDMIAEFDIKDKDPLLLKVNEYIQSRISDPNIYVSDIAEKFNLTEQQLNRRMIKLTGMSTSNYILNERIVLAKKMLVLNSYNINDISIKCGFTSSSYFIKVFKRKFGETPTDMRAKIASN